MKNPVEELTEYILLTLVVGYFAYAQYDVLFIPCRHFVPRNDNEKTDCRGRSLAMTINFDFYASYGHGNFNEPRIALYLFDGQRYFVAVYIEFLLISVQIGGNRFG